MLPTPPLLSEDAPRPVRTAGLGARFRYWRGASGGRYLFSAVPAGTLADFRAVVVLFARSAGDGRFTAEAIAEIGAAGNGSGDCRALAASAKHLTVFVHFLAPETADRRRVLGDLAATALKLAA